MTATSAADTTPAWAAILRRFTSWLVEDFGGGPRPWKFAWVINFQKAGTFFFLDALRSYRVSLSKW